RSSSPDPSFFTSFQIDSSRFGIISSDLISPPCSATATEIVSAWTSNPTNFILFINRLLSLVALYCLSSDSQHIPRLRIGAGHSILTIRDFRLSLFLVVRGTIGFIERLGAQSTRSL